MADYTRHQKKIIERYYDHKDSILLTRLGEIITEMLLADTPRKLDRQWSRAEQTMRAMKLKEDVITRLIAQRDSAELARNLRSWLSSGPK